MDTENLKKAFTRDLEALAKTRDELRVQLQLAKAEARDDWRSLEQTWGKVETEIQRIGEHAKEPVKDMGDAARALLKELGRGYARIKEQLDRTP